MGSFPLTRGKPVERDGGGRGVGLIPAHAGKTSKDVIGSPVLRAHPRSRGENQDENIVNLSKQGASPLTRGKHMGVERRGPGRGRIPAHAGKTSSWWRTSRRTSAHPRSRGENVVEDGQAPRVQGASPLTRGKHVDAELSGILKGRIPAHAGKTSRLTCYALVVEAHPRSRGENENRKRVPPMRKGASPLTRGKRRANRPHQVAHGRIPAHAGKTGSVGPRQPPRRAHPRSRGENPGVAQGSTSGSGASPLTRGKLCAAALRRLSLRRIPAHAGKTPGALSELPSCGAHPRSRGENIAWGMAPGRNWGASPLTRGKPSGSGPCPRRPWRIPAHAGKTVGA